MVTDHDGGACTDRVAIVTGGSRGIGREVARTLASSGYAVIINYARNQRDADASVEGVLAANGAALAVRADVADELDVERLFAETREAFGGVDVIVHAAPMTMLVNQQASRQLRDGGAIVNLPGSSVGLALPGHADDATSALEAITSELASGLRVRGITVNAVAPGLERPGTPAEIANLVAFLVSDEGHSINGRVIRADGGPN